MDHLYTVNYGKLYNFTGTNLEFLNPNALPRCLPNRWWIKIVETFNPACNEFNSIFLDNYGQHHKIHWHNSFRYQVRDTLYDSLPHKIDEKYNMPLPNIVIDIIQNSIYAEPQSNIFTNINYLYDKIEILKNNIILAENIRVKTLNSQITVPTFVIKNHIEQEKNTNGECAITYTSLKECDKISMLSCYHIFETEALLKARSISNNCPTCRSEGNIIYNC